MRSRAVRVEKRSALRTPSSSSRRMTPTRALSATMRPISTGECRSGRFLLANPSRRRMPVAEPCRTAMKPASEHLRQAQRQRQRQRPAQRIAQHHRLGHLLGEHYLHRGDAGEDQSERQGLGRRLGQAAVFEERRQ